MSWSCNKMGRADKLGEVIKEAFVKAGGAPEGSAEEAAKNALGGVAETLCKSLVGNPIVRIEANGSAWNVNGKAQSQYLSFKFEHLSDDFVE